MGKYHDRLCGRQNMGVEAISGKLLKPAQSLGVAIPQLGLLTVLPCAINVRNVNKVSDYLH